MKLLEISSLTVAFGGVLAVSDFNFYLNGADIVGLIGPNGAGKSTVLNAVCGLVPHRGRVAFRDQDLSSARPWKLVRYGITRTFQHPQLVPEISVLENIALGRAHQLFGHMIATGIRTPGLRRREADIHQASRSIGESVGIGEWLDYQAAHVPYGVAKLTEVARALVTTPSLLMLDEPVAGLNSSEKVVMRTLLAKIRDSHGIAMVVVDHDMDFIFGLCDRIYALNFGKLIAEGTPSAVRGDAAVTEAYFGSKARANASGAGALGWKGAPGGSAGS